MEAFLVSTAVVAVSEIGDKTQLLALILVSRFRKPIPIILGILFATLANHLVAGLLGDWIRASLSPSVLRWMLGILFIAIALWALKPDKANNDESTMSQYGVFVVTLISFFLAEIGDKTQIATVVLAAKYGALIPVVAGTTFGMLLADVPVVILGKLAAKKIPFKAIRFVAAGIFLILGLFALSGFQIG